MSLAKNVYVHILRARETKWDLCLSEQSDTTTSKAAPFYLWNITTLLKKQKSQITKKLDKAPRLSISHKINPIFSSKSTMTEKDESWNNFWTNKIIKVNISSFHGPRPILWKSNEGKWFHKIFQRKETAGTEEDLMGRRFRWRDGASVATSGSVGEQQLKSSSCAFSLILNSKGENWFCGCRGRKTE